VIVGILYSCKNKYLTIPIDSTYFKFSTTDTNDDTVVGFSEKVVKDPSLIPLKYNAIDFTTNTNIKYVDGDAKFLPEVFNF
jgi:hypothetical protein